MIYYRSSKVDPLSDVVALLRPHTAIAKPITGRGRWGARYSAYRQPGFALVLKGQCWLTVEGGEQVLMEEGDFVLLPATPTFSLYSAPGVICEQRGPVDSAVRHGDPDGDPDVEMLGGTFLIEQVNAPLLLPMLPEMIHIRAAEGDTGRLTGLIRLVMDECAADRPGRSIVLERLLEVMLVECLRWPGNDNTGLSSGLLAGMRDPALAGVLRLMHENVRGAWTVADLARRAGMSRSAFAARFSQSLGCGPMEYLARWRISLARDALSRGGKSLDRLAEEIGYESASAFSTAFRRRVGCPPGAFARQYRGAIGLA